MAAKWTNEEINQLTSNEHLRALKYVADTMNRSETAIVSKYLAETNKMDAIVAIEYNGEEVEEITANAGTTILLTAILKNAKITTNNVRWSFSGSPILGITVKVISPNKTTCLAELVGAGVATVGVRINGLTKVVKINVI